ncbi:MAG: hypothetical protein HQ589_03295 [Syntrophaceae bacterium]|nr:hypothetical protein [Syntrophaceae bacterium]
MRTLFDGRKHVLDAMVFINFHGVLLLEKLFQWSSSEIVLTPSVKKEASESKAGKISWDRYIKEGRVNFNPMKLPEEQRLFFEYLNKEIDGKVIHRGEASVLAVAIINGCGLACDEKVVRDEYKRATGLIGLHSWGLIDIAVQRGFLDEEYAESVKKGFYYV